MGYSSTKLTRTELSFLPQKKFPIVGLVNSYGFLKLEKPILERLSWGWKVGKGERTLVTLDVKDGVLTLRKY